ncbi:exodeoxyribonuclease IX [Pseudohongiella nitratireducens]|uniref:Exodeoxyribonuclease IX n=1 Tax=Pseudohongiella nitratireducens TaxID=1768907 RepID=A0A916QKR4_9GAMM|nr:5'-3' exonuclease [Pseudohongiella nitratireducens]GFZ76647.1 exodeoxyribonuclease IX [Pseudohongiella nitratireducens]
MMQNNGDLNAVSRTGSSPLYLLDASIYIFQAHFSSWQFVSSVDGEDRSAFYGFAQSLFRLLRLIGYHRAPQAVPEVQPRLAVAFDESLFSGFRHRLYADYKSNRVLPDDNLAWQLKACRSLCQSLGIPEFASEEYEADDLIGTLAHRYHQQSPVVIVSRDKDLGQLLTGDTDCLWDIQQAVPKTRAVLNEQLGIWPEQIPCYLGLTGDAVDCIPGVPGIGPKAASGLLQAYPDMPSIYAEPERIASLAFRGARTCAEKLLTFQKQAILSRQLATIVCDCQTAELAAFSDASLALQYGNLPHWNVIADHSVLGEAALQKADLMRLENAFRSLDPLRDKEGTV